MANTSITGLPVRIGLDGTEYVPIQAVGATAQRTTTGAIGRVGIASVFPASLQWVIDGGGGNISARNWGTEQVPFAATLTAAEILGDASGTAVVDIWKCTYAQFNPPTVPTIANTITGSAPLTLSSASKATADITTWTTTLLEGDILTFVTPSTCTGVTKLTIVLSLARVVS